MELIASLFRVNFFSVRKTRNSETPVAEDLTILGFSPVVSFDQGLKFSHVIDEGNLRVIH